MDDHDNTVNIKSEKRNYHHGDLRNSLINAGLEALKREDADTISLRAVAREVGVSATSVYRHFPDKQSFIDALCREGTLLLARAQREAMNAAGGGQEGLDATGFSYVRFALENPTLFRLMSKAPPSDTALGGAKDPAKKELMTNVATLMSDDTTAEEREIRAMHAWSVVHGITMLVLEGRLPNEEAVIKAVIRTPVEH
ncbi:AcrR family transcriptional regulator [Labrenzia sp. EL_13]|nr:AcrR family transcriptional regulator [Labrenzia sp. EL_13]